MATVNNVSTADMDDAGLEKLSTSNQDCLGELDFFEDEMNFLMDLVEEKLLPQIKQQKASRIEVLHSKLKRINCLKNLIRDDFMMHKNHLEAKLNHLVERSGSFLKLEHEKVEEEINNLVDSIKDTRIELLNISRKSY